LVLWGSSGTVAYSQAVMALPSLGGTGQGGRLPVPVGHFHEQDRRQIWRASRYGR
jgi:hypothetical protein